MIIFADPRAPFSCARGSAAVYGLQPAADEGLRFLAWPCYTYLMQIKVSDDKKPMTGTWYRSTIDPRVMGKVTKLEAGMCEVTFTGGGVDRCTINEFADSWELS